MKPTLTNIHPDYFTIEEVRDKYNLQTYQCNRLSMSVVDKHRFHLVLLNKDEVANYVGQFKLSEGVKLSDLAKELNLNYGCIYHLARKLNMISNNSTRLTDEQAEELRRVAPLKCKSRYKKKPKKTKTK